MAYHISNFGSFAHANITRDLDGYVPMPGDKFKDFRFDFGSDDLEDAETASHWQEDWFPGVCNANKRATEDAERELADWL